MIYFIFVLVILSIIINGYSIRHILDNVEYKRHISSHLLEINEQFQLESIIENRKIIPVTFLKLSEKFPVQLVYSSQENVLKTSEYIYHNTTMFLLPYQRIKRSYMVSFNHRGAYKLIEADITAGDFLAFKTSNKYVEYIQRVVVMPEAADLQADIMPYGGYTGNISIKRWIIEDPILNAGIREYTGVEPQKTIHWPSSLRQNKLMVKKFDYTTDSNVVIMLNIECSEPFYISIDADKIEKCLSIARALFEELESSNIPYGMWTNAEKNSAGGIGFEMLKGLGSNHFYNIMERLGSAAYTPCIEFKEAVSYISVKNANDTTYIIITPEIFDDYVDYINNLNKRCDRLAVISLQEQNLEKLDASISTFVERGDIA